MGLSDAPNLGDHVRWKGAMRKSEREMKERREIDSVIRGSQICRLGLCDKGQPYVVPLCFGYDGISLYLHSALEGRKIDILRKNNRVCFEFDRLVRMVEAKEACGWTVRYQSVIGFGTAEIILDEEEKRRGLALLMSNYSNQTFLFPDKKVQLTCLIRIHIEQLTGKQSLD